MGQNKFKVLRSPTAVAFLPAGMLRAYEGGPPNAKAAQHGAKSKKSKYWYVCIVIVRNRMGQNKFKVLRSPTAVAFLPAHSTRETRGVMFVFSPLARLLWWRWEALRQSVLRQRAVLAAAEGCGGCGCCGGVGGRQGMARGAAVVGRGHLEGL